LPGRARAAHETTIISDATGEAATSSLEGWDEVQAHKGLAFRCASEREAGDPDLSLPAEAPAIPYTAAHEGLEVFGAVAESVSQEEARAFCEQIEAPDASGESRGDWRLPTSGELLRLAPVFRGPGPFWTLDGSMVQDGEAWMEIDAKPDEALIARCIRG
jgi:hypothetical protein